MTDKSQIGESIVDTYVVDIENLHHVQRDILSHLYTVTSANYVDLKPQELTGNSFNYHLRHVVAQKLVEQTSNGKYRLSTLGCLLIDNVSLESMKLKLRPTTGITILVKSTHHGTLLYRSNREPLRGFAGLPFGKLRLGDTLAGTFNRMLQKRGLSFEAVKNIQQLGVANIRYYFQDELICHRTGSVWSADYDGPPLTTDTSHGQSFWTTEPLGEARILSEVDSIMNWPSGQTTLEIEDLVVR